MAEIDRHPVTPPSDGAADPAAALLSRFDALAPSLPGAAVPWLAERRQAARERFARLGFPSPRAESWKYTNLRELVRTGFAPAAVPVAAAAPIALPPALLAAEAGHRLVFVDGRYRPELSTHASLPEGCTLASLAECLTAGAEALEPYLGLIGDADAAGDARGGAIDALNTAFAGDGLVLRLGRGVALDQPVEALFVTSGDAGSGLHQPRLLVVAEAGSEACLVERHVGPDGMPYFANIVAEIVVEAGARLHHYKAQAEGDAAFHLAAAAIRLGRDSSYDQFVLTRGAHLSRSLLAPVLAGPGGECRLSGAYMVSGRQHADHSSMIDHAEPRCVSRQVYHGVIDDQARAVFQGKIVVRQDAQKTDGHQLNRALLLSDQAEIDSKPELEIFADDVKCSHGATAGELDDDQLFYLRARGIDRDRARDLLISGFLIEAIDEIRVAPVRAAFTEQMARWLAARRQGALA